MSSFLIKVFGVHTDYIHGVSSPAPEWPRKSNNLKFFSTQQSHNVKSLNSLDIDRILSGQLGCWKQIFSSSNTNVFSVMAERFLCQGLIRMINMFEATLNVCFPGWEILSEMIIIKYPPFIHFLLSRGLFSSRRISTELRGKCLSHSAPVTAFSPCIFHWPQTVGRRGRGFPWFLKHLILKSISGDLASTHFEPHKGWSLLTFQGGRREEGNVMSVVFWCREDLCHTRYFLLRPKC